jgi:hypothetical protein
MSDSGNSRSITDVTDHGASGDGTTDDTTAIQAAATAAANGVLYFPAGRYRVTSTINLSTQTTVRGDGMAVSILEQSTEDADGLVAIDPRFVTLRDIQVRGTGTGTGVGIHFADSSPAAQANLRFDNVYVTSWGGDGVYIDDPIASTFINVRVERVGGHGFNIQTGTSLTFHSCYVTSAVQAGYNLKSVAYCAVNGCAADSNGLAYLIDSCTGVALVCCGYESPTIGSVPYDGQGFKITGGMGHSLINCYSNGNHGVAAWFTGATLGNICMGFVETNPSETATAGIQVDSDSRVAVLTHRTVTPNSYATGSANVISDPRGNIGVGNETGPANQIEIRTGGTQNQIVARRESTVSDQASFVLSTAGNPMWATRLSHDSTNDLHIRNTNRGLDALLVEERDTAPNISLLTSTKSYGGGAGVIFLPNASTNPSTNPSNGGILYVDSGALKYRGSAGTVTTLAPA